ncbi:MAG: UDP-N-acetylmuramate--L-alanine ligase [Treponema sp.]|nr:UDP-N-acetylmuramate--L-alanine ligase [Treponema sp.]
MGSKDIFSSISNVYFVGIKGTGVCALAELMHDSGIKVSGSDIPEVFYTDAILNDLNITFFEDFDAAHITDNIDLVIYSAAYSAETNAELKKAGELNIPLLKYTDALGAWSKKFDSTGVCGVHGKTTTTAICGVLARAAGLAAQVLAGSAALDFNGRSTLVLGKKYFIAETCEYRKHFLSFSPARIILTAVESDHQDYFPDYSSILDAFVQYCRLLPKGGQLIYCADDKGASEVADIIRNDAKGIELIPYGFTALGDFKINSYKIINETAVFSLNGIPGDIVMRIPGRHEALNAAAGLALTAALIQNENSGADKKNNEAFEESLFNEDQIKSIKNALLNFKSAKRRSEIIGEACGIIFMDDYGHHPTAIKTTLEGIKSFYPKRRLIVSFMSHTYTRTSALLNEFAQCFNEADIVFFHKIYASAREDYKGGVNGRTLYERSKAARNAAGKDETHYYDEIYDTFEPLCTILKEGDIFLTLGAGNNWPLGEKLLDHFRRINSENAGEKND